MANEKLYYSTLLNDVLDQIRDTTSGHLTTNIRLRSMNRILDKIAAAFDGEYAVIRNVISFLNGEPDYSLVNNLGITDFKTYKDLRLQNAQNEYADFLTPNDFAKRLGQSKTTFSVALETRNGEKIIRILYDSGSENIIIVPAANTTENGATWLATDDAASLDEATDITKVYGSCLKFNIDVSASANDFATLTLPTFTASDLSAYEDIGKIRTWVFLPTATDIDSFTFRWGQDSSNYWEVTAVTTNALGQSFESGWNRIEFDWADATVGAGTPVATTVDWIELVTNHSLSADLNGLRVNQFKIFNPIYMELFHYSDFVAKDSDGIIIASMADSDDEILLPTNFRNCVIAGLTWQFFGILKSWTDNETLKWESDFNKELKLLRDAFGHTNTRPRPRMKVRY